MEDRSVLVPEAQYQKPQKVTVWLQEGSSDILKVFRCMVCGHVVFEYYDNVKMVVTGEAGYIKSPTVHQCKGRVRVVSINGDQYGATCKTKYEIQ